MNTEHPLYDVIQIGFGPVSEILALALARQGRRDAVFERWRERYPLPRAVCIDHEVYRLLCALGHCERSRSCNRVRPAASATVSPSISAAN